MVSCYQKYLLEQSCLRAKFVERFRVQNPNKSSANNRFNQLLLLNSDNDCSHVEEEFSFPTNKIIYEGKPSFNTSFRFFNAHIGMLFMHCFCQVHVTGKNKISQEFSQCCSKPDTTGSQTLSQRCTVKMFF